MSFMETVSKILKPLEKRYFLLVYIINFVILQLKISQISLVNHSVINHNTSDRRQVI